MDLTPKFAAPLQDSGYVTIWSRELTGSDWVRQVGGLWVSDGNFSRWDTPLPRIS